MKPEPDNAAPLVYDNSPSFINLPVSIKTKDIENQVNKVLTGLIFDDSDLEDDNLAIQVWKQAPITLQNQDGKLKTVIPLKAVIKYRYGMSKFGVDLYDTREFNLDGKINLLSTINLNNWKLNTITQFQNIDWNGSPTVAIAGKDISISYAANTALRFFKSKIEKSIDDAIENSLDFKPNVLDAMQKLSEPVLINPEYNCWLNIVPTELYATNVKLNKDDIAMQMGLKCTITTLVGQKPTNQFNRNSIALKTVTKMPNTVAANVAAVSTYKDASAILKKNFAGQEFTQGKKKVTVQNVQLWQKEGKMVIALDLIGNLNGTVYLTGVPEYKEETKEIYFDKLDYVLDTKSKLVRTANWLASGYILKKIQENCRYSIKPNLEEGKQNMAKYMKNYSPMPGVFINGNLDGITFKKIQLTNSAIIAFVTINGQMNVNVDGLD